MEARNLTTGGRSFWIRPPGVLALGLLLILGLLLTYSNHFHNGFYFDDHHTIVTNQYITDLGNLPLFFTDASTFSSLPANRAYRPVVTTLNAIDYWLAGELDPFYFHLNIFLWFVVQAVLLHVLIKGILKRACPHEWNALIALLITAFYTLHAANAETVNYIIARSDSFSTVCIVASLVLYQRAALRRWHLYLLTMVLGILTKQTGVVFVPLLFMYVAFFEPPPAVARGAGRSPLGRRLAHALWESIPALVVGVIVLLVDQLVLTPPATASTNVTVSRWAYLMTQLWVVAHYLGNFVLPLRLSADPDLAVIESIADGRILVGGGLVVALLLASGLAAARPRTRPISFGILWFFVALLPTSSIIPLYQIANDHRTFCPYIGLALAAGWSVGLLAIRLESAVRGRKALRAALTVAIAAVLAGHAYGAHQRNRVWSSDASLWHDVTVKSPGNARGLMNYGLSQMRAGNFDVALDHYRRALAISPRYSYLHVNMAILTNAMGDPAAAEQHFRSALAYGRDNPEVYRYFAKWLRDQGRAAEAREMVATGLALSPGHSEMRLLEQSLRAEEAATRADAIDSLRELIRRSPTPESHVELSLAYYQAGRYEEAIEACRQALALRPDYAVAFNNICSCYSQLGRWDLAIDACRRALEIDPGFARARANLSWAEDGKAGR